MEWLDLVTNPQGLRGIFQGDAPPLVGVSLHEVSIGREGPTLRLRFDLPTFPSNPPANWRRNGFNAVQVELLFGGISELSLHGVGVEMVVDINMEHDGRVVLDVRSPIVRVAALAASVTVSRVDAYLDAERE
ncbi:Imm50 family immunity protein [Micromonospora purpureochromogenes]|uniref:Imm50 family immunity protein n=1 Tax=Micromonospora purpureochromogenes TaxID=47872 RepID=UPI0033D6F23D